MKIATIVIMVLLVGCAGPQPATQTVYVPVHTPCVKGVPVAPIYEFDNLRPDASDGEKVIALARDWVRGRKYERALEGAFAGCQ